MAAPLGYSDQPQQNYGYGYNNNGSPDQFQQQQYQQPAPDSSHAGADPLLAPGPIQPQETVHIEKAEGLMPREVFDHDKYDIDVRADIDNLNDMKKEWRIKMQTALDTFILFNAVTTIMIILTNFRRAVPADVKEDFGEDSFDGLVGFIIYFPLFFFCTFFFLFNNFYSERTFYMYLKRGVIIDFPESASPAYLFKHVIPLVFFLIWLAYFGLTIGVMIKFSSSIGLIAIYINNMMVGIGMFWYRQQSIEYKFVSLSNFIQAFPDREGKYGNMDEQSLHSAAMYLKNVVLTESEQPSWGSYMRLFYWKNKNYSLLLKIFHHSLIFLLIFGMAGVSVAYFIIVARLDLETTWNQEISPCASSSVQLLSNAGQIVNNSTCSSAICECLSRLNYKDKSYFNGCGEYFNGGAAGLCSAVDRRCPAQCSW